MSFEAAARDRKAVTLFIITPTERPTFQIISNSYQELSGRYALVVYESEHQPNQAEAFFRKPVHDEKKRSLNLYVFEAEGSLLNDKRNLRPRESPVKFT